jgi:serine phosphatase RsbU (regulator of sigma subunit)
VTEHGRATLEIVDERDPRVAPMPLVPGARIVFTTDGVHEQRAGNGEMSGLERIPQRRASSPRCAAMRARASRTM